LCVCGQQLALRQGLHPVKSPICVLIVCRSAVMEDMGIDRFAASEFMKLVKVLRRLAGTAAVCDTEWLLAATP